MPEIPELELPEPLPPAVTQSAAVAAEPAPAVAGEPVSPAPPAADPGKAVLARIALSARGLDPLGRLLSFF
jgi:hypothetical protein